MLSPSFTNLMKGLSQKNSGLTNQQITKVFQEKKDFEEKAIGSVHSSLRLLIDSIMETEKDKEARKQLARSISPSSVSRKSFKSGEIDFDKITTNEFLKKNRLIADRMFELDRFYGESKRLSSEGEWNMIIF